MNNMEESDGSFAALRLWKRVAFNGYQPTTTSLDISLSILRWFFMLPGTKISKVYTRCNIIITAILFGFLVSITCGLFQSEYTFVTLGHDICLLLGGQLIFIKMIHFRVHIIQIEDLMITFEKLHQCNSRSSSAEICEMLRSHYLGEGLVLFTNSVLGVILFFAIWTQPLFSDQQFLPFRSKYPFSYQDSKIVFTILYWFQGICLWLYLVNIVCTDSIGYTCISQSSLNLKIICVQLRKGKSNNGNDFRTLIESHQLIINLVDKINTTFYMNFIFQVGASTLIICLTAFETLLAKDQPIVAAKFLAYMLACFMQLFYWCWLGNMVASDSLDVASAAFECGWIDQTEVFKQNLLFVIMRAQKPLILQTTPFYRFDLQAFTNILGASFSYFTLLRNLNQ